MALRIISSRKSRGSIDVEDFGGGVDFVSDPGEIALNRTPYSLNFRVSPEAKLISRFPSPNRVLIAAADLLGGVSKYLYYSPALATFLIQRDTGIYRATINASHFITAETLLYTLTTNAKIAACDFNGECVFTHPVDGVFTVSAAFAVTNRSVTAKGSCITPWQNKVWVGGDPGNKSRVWWCNIGNAAVWTTGTDFNDLRDVDGEIVTAIGGGNGMDVSGRPGLLVFKERSAYRINSSATGAYTTIDTVNGAGGSEAVASIDGKTATVSAYGIFLTDGVGKLQRVSGPLGVMFDGLYSDRTKPDQYVATVKDGCFLFSHPQLALGAGNQVYLEYHPTDGWLMMHETAATGGAEGGFISATRYSPYPDQTYALLRDGRRVVTMQDAGSAAGDSASFTPTFTWECPWVLLNGGEKARVRKFAIVGRSIGNLSWELRRDWNEATITRSAITGLNASGTSGIPTRWTPVRSLGVCRAISPKISYASANQALKSLDSPNPGNTLISIPEIQIDRLRFDCIPLDRG